VGGSNAYCPKRGFLADVTLNEVKGLASLENARFFAEFILSFAEGLRMTIDSKKIYDARH
jgi:hypothetical protein